MFFQRYRFNWFLIAAVAALLFEPALPCAGGAIGFARRLGRNAQVACHVDQNTGGLFIPLLKAQHRHTKRQHRSARLSPANPHGRSKERQP